ncbi:MAG: DUF4013 domain-containing protein [Haloferacaceae archaeon]
MLDDALAYVNGSDDLLSTVVIGGLLVPLSALVLPGLVLQGYLVRVVRESAVGDDVAPSFTEWGTLFVDGLKVLGVTLGYVLAVGVPVAVGVPLLIPDPAAIPTWGATTVFYLLGLLALLVHFLLPAACGLFALTGSVASAFNVPSVLSVAFTFEYAVPWLLSVFVGGLGLVVGVSLSPLLVGLPLLFVSLVLTAYLWGRGVGEATARRGLRPDPR